MSSTTTSSPSTMEPNKVTLDLTGRCFNTTVIIQKYESRCPWCACDNEFAVVGQLSDAESHELLYHMNSSISGSLSSDALFDIGVVSLSTIAIITSAAFSCLLIAYLRERRAHCGKNSSTDSSSKFNKQHGYKNSAPYSSTRHSTLLTKHLVNDEINR
ncbi:unnamed protein product [Gongylonema pulchrum]|uniref:C2H2-type domain-containing protein n=1 Tax=Gongylonema pulchrum TaxID=637853 RepID=A0A183E484_9BILA|nr:unnamed protein product [Gongylonema pulchrum]